MIRSPGLWPDWIATTGVEPGRHLPTVVPAGAVIGQVSAAAANRFGVSTRTVVVAGATDGCAAFLATGAGKPGDAVTSLGSTLVLKLASERPLFAPEYGLYSHRIGDLWLAGGASNTGGAVLAQFFTAEEIRNTSAGSIRPRAAVSTIIRFRPEASAFPSTIPPCSHG